VSPLILPASILGPVFDILSPITNTLGSVASAPLKAAASIGLTAVSGWVVVGAELMLHEVVKLISLVTTPSLSVSWFSASYWKISGLAMLLTVPFLFAAAVQAVVRTDMGVLVRAAFFDLPVAAIAVTVAAPLITLLLAATDEMCSLVTGGGPVGGAFLDLASSDLARAGSGAMLAIIAVIILLAGLVLTVELIMRSAAIYIVVLFLPLGFAAMVWPARRVWIKRMLELLIALILSKFAMVAILSLAVAGLGSLSTDPSSLTTALTAMALMILAAFSPWALLRLLPFTEIAAGAVTTMHQEKGVGMQRSFGHISNAAETTAGLAVDPVAAGMDGLRRFANNGSPGAGGRGGGNDPFSWIGRYGRPGLAGPESPGADGDSGGGAGLGNDGAGGGPRGGGGTGGGAVALAEFVQNGGGGGPGPSDGGGSPSPGFGPGPALGSEERPEAAVRGDGTTPPPSGDGVGTLDGGDALMPAPRPSPAGVSGSGGTPPLRPDPAGPVEDLSPVFSPDGDGSVQVNLAHPASGWLTPAEGTDGGTTDGASDAEPGR
jgi:hypothetical protein